MFAFHRGSRTANFGTIDHPTRRLNESGFGKKIKNKTTPRPKNPESNFRLWKKIEFEKGMVRLDE